MSGVTNLSGRALIVGSGLTSPAAAAVISEILAPFQHRVLEMQRIDLGGRTIIALEVALDPAHAPAISSDLNTQGAKAGLDIAMELL